MTKSSTLQFLLTFAVILSSPLCFGESKLIGANEFITKNQQLFIKQYVEIINSKNTNFYEKEIIYPICRDKLKKYPEIYDHTFKRRFKHTIPEDNTISIKDIKDNEPLPFENMFIYPVRPSHIIMIDYQKTETKSSSIIIQVIKEKNKYYEVLPYPNRETLEKFKNKTSNKKNTAVHK